MSRKVSLGRAGRHSSTKPAGRHVPYQCRHCRREKSIMDLHAGECFKCCGCSEDDPCSTSVAFSGSRWLKIREEVRGARSTLATSTITSENEAGVRGKVASYRPESRPRQTGDEPSRKSKSPVHRPKGKSNRPVCGEQVRGRESPARSMAEPRKKRPAARSSSLPTKKPRQPLRTTPESSMKEVAHYWNNMPITYKFAPSTNHFKNLLDGDPKYITLFTEYDE